MLIFVLILICIASGSFAFMIHYRNEAWKMTEKYGDELTQRLRAEEEKYKAEQQFRELNFKHLMLSTDYKLVMAEFKKQTGYDYQTTGSKIHGVTPYETPPYVKEEIEVDTTVMDWLE